MDRDDKAHQSSAADGLLVSSTFSSELVSDLLPEERRVIGSVGFGLGQGGC